MPLYEYHCAACGEDVEHLSLANADRDEAMPRFCPKCNAAASLTPRISKLGKMHFKGEGFHVNDYKKSKPQNTKTVHSVGAPEGSGDE